jgi:D-alanine--poly(phosphoribitol) ligase subunit 1
MKPIADVIDLFLATAAARGSKAAISVHGRTLSYEDFEHRVRQFAGALSRNAGSGVMIALPQGPDAYAAMLGAGLAGCYYAPLNVEVPIAKLQKVVEIMDPAAIVAAPPLLSALTGVAPTATAVDPNNGLGPVLTGPGSRHEIAYIIFTSGTTGTPKGVVIPRSALDHFVDWVDRSKTITAEDRVAQFSNIAFDVSVTDIYGGFCLGATVCPVIGRADRMYPARLVAREQVTLWNSTPSVISLMSWAGEVTGELLGSLRLINTCGEALLPAHMQAIFAALPDMTVQNSYGPTETTVTMTELRLNRHNFQSACEASVAIGPPIERMSIQLLGGQHDDEGEIVIAGPQLAMGYWRDQERTERAFKTVRMQGEPVRAYFSGDWAERRNGHIFFKERIDLQVKIRGVRLELEEIAHAIRDEGFPVTCVLKWRDELAAVIERRPGHSFDELTLRSGLAKRLEAHAIPAVIRPIDLIPRNQNDKLDRVAVGKWLDMQEMTGGIRASGN